MNKSYAFLSGLLFFVAFSLQAQSTEYGSATYYGDYMQGQRTAYGEFYDRAQMTCAHPSYPKNMVLQVTRLDNNKSVLVRVNDKMPFRQGYVISVSLAAGVLLGLDTDGTAQVSLQPVGYSEVNPPNPLTRPAVPPTSSNLTARSGAIPPPPQSYDNSPVPAAPASRAAAVPQGYEMLPRPADAAPTQTKTASTTTKGAKLKVIPANATGYIIQIGAYKEAANAARQGQALLDLGLPQLFIAPGKGADGQPVHRLIVGPFSDRNAAVAEKERLRTQYLINGIVTFM
ncbi:MAG: septal ring lytic transglycosylase RlpA family protein [Lewinellaceae bacterium]|nr:septal ring lytic transglycosylase RlpA family protein [Lewinellaceae bacterium]